MLFGYKGQLGLFARAWWYSNKRVAPVYDGLYLKKYTKINNQTIFSTSLMSFIDKKPKLNKEWTEKKYDKSHGQSGLSNL